MPDYYHVYTVAPKYLEWRYCVMQVMKDKTFKRPSPQCCEPDTVKCPVEILVTLPFVPGTENN